MKMSLTVVDSLLSSLQVAGQIIISVRGMGIIILLFCVLTIYVAIHNVGFTVFIKDLVNSFTGKEEGSERLKCQTTEIEVSLARSKPLKIGN